MTKKTNIQLTSNVYPVRVNGESIDFTENKDFVRRIWDREALIKLFQIVHNMPIDKSYVQKYAKAIPGISEWQIRRMITPDECSLALPGEKPWGIVMRGESFKEVCKCDMRDCNYFAKCRQLTENKDGFKK